jgi:hypothetical protein
MHRGGALQRERNTWISGIEQKMQKTARKTVGKFSGIYI